MSKLRGLSRRINKGKSRVNIGMEKQLQVKNGYLKIKFPLTTEQFEIFDLFIDYMMAFVYGDKNMNNPLDAKEWETKVKLYVDLLFGVNAYHKCFGNSIASHEEIGALFEQFNVLIRECKEEVKQFRSLIADFEKNMKK